MKGNKTNRKKSRSLYTILVVLMLLANALLAGCGQAKTDEYQSAPSAQPSSAASQKLKDVTLVLDWTPNTNHTGLYVAEDQGYYREQGLNVKIIQPGKSTAEQIVAANQAQFGVSYQEGVTEARTQNVPIVSIAAVIQHNTSGFASPADKNIKSPKDFEGKTYGSFGSPVEKAVIQSIMETQNADVNKVKFVNIGDTDFFTAVQKNIDFSWIFYGWDGIEANLRGMKINMVYLNQFSKQLDYYTPVLITNETMINANSKTVEAFMAATSKGYHYAIDHPDQAAQILLKYAPDLDKKLVIASQKWLSPRYQDDAAQWGVQKNEVWQGYTDWMYNHKVLANKIDVSKAFTNKFLPKG